MTVHDESKLFEILEEMAQKVGVKVPPVRITDIPLNAAPHVFSLNYNAAALPFGDKPLLLGKNFRDILQDKPGTTSHDMLKSVIAHELGHVKHDMHGAAAFKATIAAPVAGVAIRMTALGLYRYYAHHHGKEALTAELDGTLDETDLPQAKGGIPCLLRPNILRRACLG